MKIYEIEKDQNINLDIHIENGKDLTWICPVKECFPKKNCIIVSVLKIDDKILNLNQIDHKAVVTIIQDEKPFIFKPCSTQYIQLNNEKYHAIFCTQSGVHINRRNYYRINVDEYCYVNYGKSVLDAFITNISSSGFAFIINDWDAVKMEFIQLSYYDSLLERDISLTGRVVRIEPKENGKTLVGCYMIPQKNITNYIQERQRRMIRSI